MRLTSNAKYCSSCHRQYLDSSYVDFEAYIDGPAYKQSNGDYIGGDDLILCEKCLKTAGSLVGLFPSEQLEKENKELGEALEVKHREYVELHEAFSDLEKSFEKLSNAKIARPKRKPKIVEKV